MVGEIDPEGSESLPSMAKVLCSGSDHDLKRPLANYPMASNFSFGLMAYSEVNEILVLLGQTIGGFFYCLLYPIILG